MKKRFPIFFSILAAILLAGTGESPGGLEHSALGARPVAAAAFRSPAGPRLPAITASTDHGRMPLYFIANRGQLDARVDYYIQGADMALYFTSKGITFVLGGPPAPAGGREPEPAGEGKAGRTQPAKAGPEAMGAGRWVVKLDFIAANRDVRAVGRDETPAAISYFRGRPEDWRTGVPTYSKIVYGGLWPGIDLAYSGDIHKLKYEFVVHPGADPSMIRLAYRGAAGVRINDDGQLEVTTPAGDFRDDSPVAYQEIDGKKVNVPLAYRLGQDSGAGVESGDAGAGAEYTVTKPHVYGFTVAGYDRTKPLILDPAVIVYCGYVGGSGYENQRGGIAVDAAGNAYIVGVTASSQSSFPVSVGPDLTYAGGYDAFVAKINAAGTALIYCGYIGGSGGDDGHGIAVDGAGAAYIVGTTDNSETEGFPVTVGPDLTFGGGTYDAFVAKVDPSGTALNYCGYIGGQNDDEGFGVAVDAPGNAYVCGNTESDQATFPVKVGPDLTANGGSDAYIAKVKADGTGLLYCGYVGGGGFDSGFAVKTDNGGSAYLTGYTESSQTDFPVAVGPDLTFNGDRDAFVAKVTVAGTGLAYCGYIGGAGEDIGEGIDVDPSGNAYVCGYTDSDQATFPVRVGPDLTFNNPPGYQEAWIAKVKSDGTILDYCGYIGGASNESAMGVAADLSGCAYVMGNVSSSEATFPVSGGPDLTYNGQADLFVAKVRSDGAGLVYCGYLGGTNTEVALGIAVGGPNAVYLFGQTNSNPSSLPVRVGPDLTHNGGYDVFVSKVISWDDWTPKHAVGDFDGDGADEMAVDFGSTGIYLYDGGAWSQISAANPESLLAADVDGDTDDEVLADLGAAGLWLWNGGVWGQLSGVNVEGLAAGDVDADGSDEAVGDFGAVGLWLFNAGAWTQLSGVKADFMTIANLDGMGGDEIVGDFGATGLWLWNAGGWTQLSGVNSDYVTAGNTDGTGGQDLIGDFGATGLWLWSAGTWTQLSGVNADYMIMANIDGDTDDEIAGDFAATGLWLWNSGAWAILSGVNAEFMIRADLDGNGTTEVAADFGAIGLWLWNSGAWIQASGVNAEYLAGGDFDGDGSDEIMADFATLGLWLYNGGSWTQASPLNPE